ncbi:MAG: hypothetical protein JSS17_02340 [Proteobacteria bacterium]|nr:hypothetical protein [Pseudomonadota bacterium]
MKSLALFALSAISTAAMAVTPAPSSGISIVGTSAQTVSVSGGHVKNDATSYSFANQNIASNKGHVTVLGSSTQSSSLDNANVTNMAKHAGDVAMQNLASNVGSVSVDGVLQLIPPKWIAGKSEQTADVKNSTVSNEANGSQGCNGNDCRDAALAYQNLASNMGNIDIDGTSKQTVGVSGDSAVKNKADGPQTQAVQNLSSNYGKVSIAGTSTQTTWVSAGAVIANLAHGRAAHAVQNIASNDSCDPPPTVCVGVSCGPYASR